MLTGTPLDLTPLGSLMGSIGFIYWALAALGIWLALRGGSAWSVKLWRLLPVVLLFGVFPGRLAWQLHQARSRYETSAKLLQERCKLAGERIHRSVENVEGIVWMKWREPYSNSDNFADQFKLNDPYGRDCGEEDCITPLLRVTAGAALNPPEAKRHKSGYRFVETVDPRDQLRYRYVGVIEQGWKQEEVEKFRKEKRAEPPEYSYRFKAGRVPIDQFSTRYGTIWADISTREDREHWIAGSSLKVIDLQSNEVLAERVGYMMDPGQGSQAGFRSPWLYAAEMACPKFSQIGPSDTRPGRTLHEALDFLVKVLVPSNGDQK